MDWTKLISDNGKKFDTENVTLVNRYFNQIPFVSDMELWGLQDYWATPLELLASNGGDCELSSTTKSATRSDSEWIPSAIRPCDPVSEFLYPDLVAYSAYQSVSANRF